RRGCARLACTEPMPRVSVIVPAFDAGPYLDETIASVAAQSLADWELTVVDDGSGDGTAAIAEAWAKPDARVHVVRQPRRRAVAAARNAGLRAADADAPYLLFLDADDCLEPTALAVLAGYLDDRPGVGMAHCAYTLIDGQGHPLESSGEPWTP